MKKIMVALILGLLIITTGCGKDTKDLDLDKIGSAIDSLESAEFARITASEILNQNIEDLEEVYDTSFKKLFKINKDNIEEYNVAINKKKTQMYFILKPVEGKLNDVKKEVDTYINSLKKDIKENLIYEEYQGYLIYIIAENSSELMNQVKEARDKLFTNLTEVNDEVLKNRYDIDKDLVEEYLIKIPEMMVNSNAYAIIKPTKDNYDTVKDKMNTYMDNLEEQWKTYLPDQYDLVKNRLEEEYEGYLIYIISKDNDAVLEAIKADYSLE